jgi:hypothetical protein
VAAEIVECGREHGIEAEFHGKIHEQDGVSIQFSRGILTDIVGSLLFTAVPSRESQRPIEFQAVYAALSKMFD